MLSSINGAPADALQTSSVFVDYENLYQVMRERAPSGTNVHDVVLDLIEDVCHVLSQRKDIHLSRVVAYADYSEMPSNGVRIQHELGKRGIEPRFVSRSMQVNAVELQLCVDAVGAACRTDTGILTIISGDRLYLPAVQYIEKLGRRAQVAVLSRPAAAEHLLPLQSCIEGVSDLLSRDFFEDAGEARNGSGDLSSYGEGDVVAGDTGRQYRDLTDPLCVEALEIIEEYFGKYDEIYLTPLLRKLSEVFEDEGRDPKSLISDLEAAGAVWLEKRKGSPHDFTVLLIDRNHPDMLRIISERPAYLEGDTVAAYRYDDTLDGPLYE